MKKEFNIKLTTFLVSLFISLLILILGNKNKYCLSFGFIALGVSLALYVWFNNEKTSKLVEHVNDEIDEISKDESISEEDKIFITSELEQRQLKLMKQRTKTNIVFYMSAAIVVLLAVIALF